MSRPQVTLTQIFSGKKRIQRKDLNTVKKKKDKDLNGHKKIQKGSSLIKKRIQRKDLNTVKKTKDKDLNGDKKIPKASLIKKKDKGYHKKIQRLPTDCACMGKLKKLKAQIAELREQQLLQQTQISKLKETFSSKFL